MSKSARWSAALWLLFAMVVFNVTFDWETRAAGYAFVSSQVARQQAGQPTISINDGFRPMVHAAARHSSVWLVGIAAFGLAATTAAARQKS
jgi:predicted short-subunit dehydrogenase-like oxidoreductase (DUF2520 family)